MRLFNPIFRHLFYCLIIWPILLIVVGINARHSERLPKKGPALLVANHNSHLDVWVILSLLPLSIHHTVRMAASADYFLKKKWLSWFFTEILRIIPIKRSTNEEHQIQERYPLKGVSEALEKNEIVIFFPEGTRGEPEKMATFKSGISWISRRHPDVPIYPIFLHGLGKSLPKGEALLVPFFCDVFVGEPFFWNGDKVNFLKILQTKIQLLASEGNFPKWE